MKAFWTYTLARLAVFVVVAAVLWGVSLLVFEDRSSLIDLVVLFLALVISSIVSIFALTRQREALALEVQTRAERMSKRIEESRSAEDVD